MWYVSWIREYPIYEPAEGGYYYAGEQVFHLAIYKTWKQARRAYEKLKKEFLDYCDFYGEEAICQDCGGVGRYLRPCVRKPSKYVGQEEWVQLTRRRPVERGRVPYC